MRAILCPFIFALGGALAVGIVAAIFVFNQSEHLLQFMLAAAGAGFISWLGVGLGCTLRRRGNGQMLSDRRMMLLTLAVLIFYMLWGAGLTLIGEKVQSLGIALLIATLASVPLLHGISLGYNEWPNAALGSILGLWQGALFGVLFGLGAAIMVSMTYVPPPCPLPPSIHCINLPPIFSSGLTFVISLFGGFGLGLADAGAAAIGLLLCPLPRPSETVQ